MRLPLGRRRLATVEAPAGVALCGHVWAGDGEEYDDGMVVVDADGIVVALGHAAEVSAPAGAVFVEAAWVGPGITDAHVHLAFGATDEMLDGGVVSVRDLGAPPHAAAQWRLLRAPRVRVAGPLLTAPGGYPSRSWGSAGFAAFVDDPAQARRLVAGLCEQVDVVKLAIEPAAGPTPPPEVCAAVVAAAHSAGRQVTCHALSLDAVELALAAGVDELAHTPTEPLPAALVARIAAAGVVVVSTLQTFVSGGVGDVAVANARALRAAGVDLRYGTDLGNGGTRPGADPAELRLLAEGVGLGAEGALRAASEPLVVGAPGGVVALDTDPRDQPETWRRPRAVAVAGMLRVRR